MSPSYSPDELQELFEIIFLGHAKPEKLILMDKLLFNDSRELELHLEHVLNKDTVFKKRKKQYQDIKEVLFCDKLRLPLMLKHRFYKVVRWRLLHGK
jgi:hypothetical protein